MSPTKPTHVLSDFENDQVYILDGGACDFGIESTVVKFYYEETSDPEKLQIKLLILRRGGISEKALKNAVKEIKLKNEGIEIVVECVEKKHFTEESHKMEAPGQFLRHYAPNLPSYMLSETKIDSEEIGKDLKLSSCVMLDFHKQNVDLKDKCSLYLDLSERGDYIEAINKVYDYLRISETQEDGEMVIIANLTTTYDGDSDDSSHNEHSSALFDRLFRAVTGQCIQVNEDFSKYIISKL